MEKVLVEVISIPVRYDSVTYFEGDTLQVLPAHINKDFMKVLGEVAQDQTDPHDTIPPSILDRGGLKLLSLDGLKDYAKSHNIDLGKSTSQDAIIKKITDAQSDGK